MVEATADGGSDLTELVHGGMPFAKYLGVSGIVGGAEEVRAVLPWMTERCTDSGATHGGALMGLADVLGGVVAFLNLPQGAGGTTTIESKTNFFRAATGPVTAVARPLHVGRTTIVIDTDIFDGEGRRVARVTQTQAVLGAA